MITPDDKRNLRYYFAPEFNKGNKLPNARSVEDFTIFFLHSTDGTWEEHIMFNGRWHRKVVDLNSKVVLEEV